MKKFLFLIASLSAIIWSCKKDFVVENISKKTLTVNAPANDAVTTINLVTFWWDELDGAEEYNLQIVRPNFTNAVQLLLDTNITTNKFNYSFKPGTYQWRIKAKNAGYSTVAQTFNIRIDTTSDLSEQFVNLLSPSNGAVTGNTLVTFSWSSLTVAKKYKLQITNNTFTFDTVLTGKTTLSYKLLAAKNATTAFSWNVKAINDFSESQYNATPFSVIVDLKGPSLPGITFSPGHGGSVSLQDSLKWSRSNESVIDSIYVADDSLFTNLLQQIPVVEKYLPAQDLNLPVSTGSSFYWWKIRSFDAYGNPSSYSARRKFKITP